MTIYTTHFNYTHIPSLWNSTIGIEREGLRVDAKGSLSKNQHPSQWGSRNHHPYIQTDFAEAQLELITPPDKDTQAIMNWLAAIHQITATSLQDRSEFLWPFSSPAYIPSNENDITIAQLENQEEFNYRSYLAEYYGKYVQLISGIHFNFQLALPAVEEAGRNSDLDCLSFNHQVYMHLTRNYFRYRWLLTYWLGASPFVDDNYSTKLFGKPDALPMRSVRQSYFGYRNKEDFKIDYTSLENFIDSLQHAVNSKSLSKEKELYRDVRLRGASYSHDFLTKEINYLEFRNIDLNPFTPYGIDRISLDLIKLFLISLLYLPDVSTQEELDKGDSYNTLTAQSHPLEGPIDKEEAQFLLATMKEVINHLADKPGDLIDYLKTLEASLESPEFTLAGRIYVKADDFPSYIDLGLSLAQEHRTQYSLTPYSLHGFTDLELSTQDVIKEAIQAGISVELLDRSENFIELSHQGHTEIVRNANMTRLDSLISYFAMENKVVTKNLLASGGLRVPMGESFNDFQQASLYYPHLNPKGVVVKPKNTNYGLGITIFKTIPNEEDYQNAIRYAFKEDSTILVETYIEGTELRFYVQNGHTLSIVERQAAHVIADGINTIEALVNKENQNPLRGSNHQAPLTLLAKGPIEQLQLKNQGYNFNSIPPKGVKVLLRENSNVSTGGISIDRTDQVHVSYHRLAEEAAEILQANFCGVDIIIEDYTQAATIDNYAIIEANFNPMITLHRYPAIGTERLIGKAVLQQLFPEIYDNQ